MSEIIRLRTRAEIDEEAATWVWRMEPGAYTAADEQAYQAWLRQDPRHQAALDEMRRVWGALDHLAEVRREEKIATFTDAARRHARAGRRRWLWAAAAALVVIAGGLAWLWPGSERQTLATAVGQHRDFRLADGSVVALNTNSIVEVDLGRTARHVQLRQGEAHFQVAHDRARPFLVQAGDAVVRAVGTEFAVRLRGDQHVEVMVNEGRVEVQTTPAAAGAASAPARPPTVHALAAGEQLSTATPGAVVAVSPGELSSELAWRQGAIVFDNEPLAEAVTEIERYTNTRIVVSDPEVRSLRLGGRFRTDDLPGFLDGLQTALPVSVRRGDGGVVYVEPRH